MIQSGLPRGARGIWRDAGVTEGQALLLDGIAPIVEPPVGGVVPVGVVLRPELVQLLESSPAACRCVSLRCSIVCTLDRMPTLGVFDLALHMTPAQPS